VAGGWWLVAGEKKILSVLSVLSVLSILSILSVPVLVFLFAGAGFLENPLEIRLYFS